MAETRAVRVLVDVTGIHKVFDYVVPADLGPVRIGSEVRVRLGPRALRGWVTAVDVEPPEGVTIQPIVAVRGIGPAPDLLALADWAAWRWAGHPAHFLRIASAPTIVTTLPPRSRRPTGDLRASSAAGVIPVVDVLADASTVVRLPPAHDRRPVIVDLLAARSETVPGSSMIIACPSVRSAHRLVVGLRAVGFPVVDFSDASLPGGVRSQAWAQAASGGSVVVGTRNVAWAPAPDLSLVVVVDEHDEAYQSTRVPTWNARDVLGERARRAGADFVQLSPCPSLESLTGSRLIVPERRVERAGWPMVEVIDRRGEDPRYGSSLFSESLGSLLADSGSTVCVLNRTGRVRLLACRGCDALVRCEACGAGVHAPATAMLVCPRCGSERPRVCDACGSAALKNLRVGVSRARDELESLIGEPVVEVTADAAPGPDPSSARVLIGTEAVL
ncbi:MAG: hypothetical protein JST73_01910, partial [Actinobacteria bacterium]|nr:hypothetical protein [Actinomycetota bacterium]